MLNWNDSSNVILYNLCTKYYECSSKIYFLKMFYCSMVLQLHTSCQQYHVLYSIPRLKLLTFSFESIATLQSYFFANYANNESAHHSVATEVNPTVTAVATVAMLYSRMIKLIKKGVFSQWKCLNLQHKSIVIEYKTHHNGQWKCCCSSTLYFWCIYNRFMLL